MVGRILSLSANWARRILRLRHQSRPGRGAENPLRELTEEEQRRWWRLRWLSSIQAFADSATQRERWLDPNERNPHYSLVECMCCYFDDALLGAPGAYRQRLERGHVSIPEIQAAAEFHAAAAAYRSPGGDDWDAAAILDDPAWHRVVEAAGQAQRRLLGLLTDPAERDALTRPLEWTGDDGVYRCATTGSTIVRGGK